jgi:iron complex outermembrane receptor protein
VAAAGQNGTFVDVSLLPLSAIDRVEILTDGASAIYGSDAVAGVVNFITRRDFSGLELNSRVGLSGGGGAEEYGFGATAGKSWDKGNILLTYDYQKQKPLFSSQRDFVPPQPQDTALSPSQKRNSLLGVGRIEIGSSTSVQASGLWSRREYVQDYFLSGLINHAEGASRQWAGSLSIDHSFSNLWKVKVTGGTSQFKSTTAVSTPGSTFVQSNGQESFLTFGDLIFSGNIDPNNFNVSLSFGASARREGYNDFSVGSGNTGKNVSRDVVSAYGELLWPIINNPGSSDISRVEATVAGRYDHYSDIGSSFDPKFGLAVDFGKHLRLRSTYTEAFRAPTMSQRGSPSTYFGFALPDPLSPTGSTRTFILGGVGLKPLGPESSKSWTVGFDWKNEKLKFSATFFNIDYRNRIASAPVVGSLFSALSQPALASFIVRNPSLQAIQDILNTQWV